MGAHVLEAFLPLSVLATSYPTSQLFLPQQASIVLANDRSSDVGRDRKMEVEKHLALYSASTTNTIHTTMATLRLSFSGALRLPMALSS